MKKIYLKNKKFIKKKKHVQQINVSSIEQVYDYLKGKSLNLLFSDVDGVLKKKDDAVRLRHISPYNKILNEIKKIIPASLGSHYGLTSPYLEEEKGKTAFYLSEISNLTPVIGCTALPSRLQFSSGEVIRCTDMRFDNLKKMGVDFSKLSRSFYDIDELILIKDGDFSRVLHKGIIYTVNDKKEESIAVFIALAKKKKLWDDNGGFAILDDSPFVIERVIKWAEENEMPCLAFLFSKPLPKVSDEEFTKFFIDKGEEFKNLKTQHIERIYGPYISK